MSDHWRSLGDATVLLVQGVMLDRIMLKPSMVAPGADCEKKSNAEEVAAMTLKMLASRVPPCVPGIMFLSGGEAPPLHLALHKHSVLFGPSNLAAACSFGIPLTIEFHSCTGRLLLNSTFGILI